MGTEPLLGVLKATVRDPPDRAPGAKLSYGLNDQQASGVGGRPARFSRLHGVPVGIQELSCKTAGWGFESPRQLPQGCSGPGHELAARLGVRPACTTCAVHGPHMSLATHASRPAGQGWPAAELMDQLFVTRC